MVSVETTNEIILLKELNHRVTVLEAKLLTLSRVTSGTDVDKKDALDDYNNENLPLLVFAMTGTVSAIVGATLRWWWQ